MELGENETDWEMIGLLHDIDFEKITGPHEHTVIAEEILKEKIPSEWIRTIKSHNFEHTNTHPDKKTDYCLIAADAVSGLVVAAALVVPSKKLADVGTDSLQRKFREKDFARNCSREKIMYCEKLGLGKEKFLEVALTSMRDVSEELGL
jgi:predicted hydrolase (HD superfamily)